VDRSEEKDRKRKRDDDQEITLPPAKKKQTIETCRPIDILVNPRSKIEDFIIIEDLKGLLNHLRDADLHLESHDIFMLEKLALKNTSCIHTAKIVQFLLSEKSPESAKLFKKAILSNRSSLRVSLKKFLKN